MGIISDKQQHISITIEILQGAPIMHA